MTHSLGNEGGAILKLGGFGIGPVLEKRFWRQCSGCQCMRTSDSCVTQKNDVATFVGGRWVASPILSLYMDAS
jgi:hypothetical protein